MKEILTCWIQEETQLVKRPLCPAAIILIMLLWCLTGIQSALGQSNFPAVMDGRQITAVGQIYKKETKNEKTILYLKLKQIEMNTSEFPNKILTARIIVYPKGSGQYRIGNLIKVSGRLKIPAFPTNKGQFNEKYYYQALQIDALLLNADCFILNEKCSVYLEMLETLKKVFLQTLKKTACQEDYPMFQAILFGNKTELGQEIKDLYRRNGIAHLLAISGLHLSIIGTGLYKLLRRIGAGFCTAGILSGGIIFHYALLTGFQVSAKRAFVMFGLMLGARVMGRSYDILSALALSAIFILLSEPYFLFHTGFLLSFSAVIGIGAIKPVLDSCAGEAAFFSKYISAGLSIQITTFPILVFFYYEITVYSICLNLIVIPLMSVIIISGSFGVLLGLFAAVLGKAVILPGHYVLRFYEILCIVFLKFPKAVLITGQPEFWRVIFYYTVLLIVCLLISRFQKKRYLVLILIASVFLCFKIRHGLTITMLDVGQGEAICLELPDGSNWLIDGGSSDVKNIGIYRLEPFLKAKGIGALDYVIITHTDIDHISGIQELIQREEIQIKYMILPFLQEEDENDREIVKIAEQKGIKILRIQEGTVIKQDEVWLECLHPSKQFTPASKNSSSIVVSLNYKNFSMLFTGDLEEDGEYELLRKKKIKDYDVLKVGHHGSKYSTGIEFLRAANPEAAIISCGKNNRYGHPHKELKERLYDESAAVYATPDCGAITIRSDGKKYKLEGFLWNQR